MAHYTRYTGHLILKMPWTASRSLESHLGVMLPCNVVVQEHENGCVEVSTVNPLNSINQEASTPQLVNLAREVGEQLRAALDDVQIHHDPGQPHALPTP